MITNWLCRIGDHRKLTSYSLFFCKCNASFNFTYLPPRLPLYFALIKTQQLLPIIIILFFTSCKLCCKLCETIQDANNFFLNREGRDGDEEFFFYSIGA